MRNAAYIVNTLPRCGSTIIHVWLRSILQLTGQTVQPERLSPDDWIGECRGPIKGLWTFKTHKLFTVHDTADVFVLTCRRDVSDALESYRRFMNFTEERAESCRERFVENMDKMAGTADLVLNYRDVIEIPANVIKAIADFCLVETSEAWRTQLSETYERSKVKRMIRGMDERANIANCERAFCKVTGFQTGHVA